MTTTIEEYPGGIDPRFGTPMTLDDAIVVEDDGE